MYRFTGIVGLLLMISPYVLSYANNAAAAWTSVTAGLIIFVVSVWEAIQIRKQNWEYWVTEIVGILAILSPFLLGFHTHTIAMWTTTTFGIIIALLAGSKLMTKRFKA